MPTTFDKTTRSDIYNIRHDTDSVGIQMIEDAQHPDYDPRVELPPDAELMASIRMVGQLQPASGYKVAGPDGKPVIVLLFGRQRWKAIQEIWREMRERGEDMSLAPVFKVCLQRDGGPASRRERRIIENRHRQGLDGIALAREVASHLAIVGDDDQAIEATRVLFNFKSTAALRNCLALLETTEKVQAEVVAGTLSPTAALQLSRQPSEIQDAVVDRIHEQGAEPEEEQDSEQIDAFAPEEMPASEPKPSKPASVSEVKEMIREQKGEANYAMVSLKQVEKRLEKVESDLDKALTKLEESTTKTEEHAARVAKLQGWGEALRWARGETVSSGKGAESQGNDKMSAAWHALAEALVSAEWPRVIRSNREAGYPVWEPQKRGEDPNYEATYRAQCHEARKRQSLSYWLFVAGEPVAKRGLENGVTCSIEINVASKWFTRLVDSYGSASKLIREWGAHGWLEKRGARSTTPVYRSRWSQYDYSFDGIKIEFNQVARMVEGTPLAAPRPAEEIILEIVRDNVPAGKVDLVTREARFGSPWLSCEEEGVIGPDLGEDDNARDCIIDEIWSELGVSIPDPAFASVGELIDYVAGVISTREAGHGA